MKKWLVPVVVVLAVLACAAGFLAPELVLVLVIVASISATAYVVSRIFSRPKTAAVIAAVVTVLVTAAGARMVVVLGDLSVRSSCQSQLHVLDLAIQAFCYGSDGKRPMNLTALGSNDISSYAFVCPGDMHARPAADLSEAWENASYIYVAGSSYDCPSDMPVILCPPMNHRGRGGNALFADHTTRYIDAEAFEKLIDRLYADTNLTIVVGSDLATRSNGRYRSRP